MNLWIGFRGGCPHVLRYWCDFVSGTATILTDNAGTQLTDDSGVLLTQS